MFICNFYLHFGLKIFHALLLLEEGITEDIKGLDSKKKFISKQIKKNEKNKPESFTSLGN